MRALILVHRWLGVAFCLLFAMWFASGIVMHFIAFPALTEAERVAGLADIDRTLPRRDPQSAIAASGLADAARARLISRADGLVYVVQGASGVHALKADDLTPAGVQSADMAVKIAASHARRRGLMAQAASFEELSDYDQWTVSNSLDAHRPLYRIALNDDAVTELYVSSTTGEVVRDTTRCERWWNYAGSVAHWIYPTALRRNLNVWLDTVWALSLAALIAALSGAVLGVWSIQIAGNRIRSPHAGWHAWHHWSGLACMIFLLTWIFSGWLSMDHGGLFSTGKLTPAEAAAAADAAAWKTFSPSEFAAPSRNAREVEWFALDGRIYRRERFDATTQILSVNDGTSQPGRKFLQPAEITALGAGLASNCQPATTINSTDDYPALSTVQDAPVYRLICGTTWFHVDGASGLVVEKLDASRRAYRWLYQALHTLDFPALAARPVLRTVLITLLCVLGALFSITAVVIAWRRLRRPVL